MSKKLADNKQLVRNAEIKNAKFTKPKVKRLPDPSTKSTTTSKTPLSELGMGILRKPANSLEARKFHSPEMHSTLMYAKEIDRLNKLKCGKITNAEQLTPKSKKLVAQKTTKAMNFGIADIVYKELAPINQEPQCINQFKSTKRIPQKAFKGSTKKDPVPSLDDFIERRRPPYQLKKALLDEPVVVLNPPETNNYSSVYNLLTMSNGSSAETSDSRIF